MAVPSNPTATSIVTQALRRAGRTNPSNTQIQEALEHQLQEVKADIMLIASTHPHLRTTATTMTTRGQQRYAIPADANEHIGISLLNGPDDWRGTAQGGSPTAIILASSMSTASSDDLVGKYILITSGAGEEEYREIIGYDAGTQTASVDTQWVSTPNAASTYLVVTQYQQLWPSDTSTELDRIDASTVLGTPQIASIYSQEFMLYPVPDKSTYGLMNRYWVDLSKLDEESDLFIQLLREWRSVWVQGVAVKSMQRFDEDRYQSESSVYKLMLDLLASQTCQVSQVRPFDVA